MGSFTPASLLSQLDIDLVWERYAVVQIKGAQQTRRGTLPYCSVMMQQNRGNRGSERRLRVLGVTAELDCLR